MIAHISLDVAGYQLIRLGYDDIAFVEVFQRHQFSRSLPTTNSMLESLFLTVLA